MVRLFCSHHDYFNARNRTLLLIITVITPAKDVFVLFLLCDCEEYAQFSDRRLSVRLSVCLSLCASVCQTRVL